MKTNELAGRKFHHPLFIGTGKIIAEFVITWNDGNHVRATPLLDETGLLSYEFLIEDVIDILEEE